MPAKSKPTPKHWCEKLDEQDVREAFEDATVDAYGEYEQHTALLTAIQTCNGSSKGGSFSRPASNSFFQALSLAESI